MTIQSSNDFQTVGKLFEQDSHVLVACSGGVDSIVLAHAIVEHADCRLVSICYVDHNIHKETAAQWRTVEALAQKLKVKSYRVEVDSQAIVKGNGPEDAARRERYRCLEKCRAEIGADCIALGHHADDQIETFIIRLAQGSGLFGLRGMEPVHGTLRRPLLTFRKSEVQQYAAQLGLVASEDPTNGSERYLRNRIRHSLLPVANASLGSQWTNHVLNLMNEFKQRAALDLHLADALFERFCSVQSGGVSIYRHQFGDLFAHEQYVLARLCLEKLLGRGATRREQILRLIEELKASSSVHRWQLTDKLWVFGEYDYAFIGTLDSSPTPEIIITSEGVYDWGEWRVGVNIPVEGGKKVKIEIGPPPLRIILRPPRLGEVYKSARGTKKISRLLIDAKIPRRLRSKVLVIETNSGIEWLWLSKERASKLSHDVRAITVWVAAPNEFLRGG